MEPRCGVAGVTCVTRREADDGALQELYLGSYPRLVAVVAVIAGSRHEAEEAVQEAFVRLIGKWSRLAGYEDPEAWLRRVALGVLANRRRKVRNGLRALRRHGVVPDEDGPTGVAVDLQRALRSLPGSQREALVLHHYLGLTVEEIAQQLSVPVGTVKSRLGRGRAALAPLLREEIGDHV